MKKFRIIFTGIIFAAIALNIYLLSYANNFTYNVSVAPKSTYTVGDSVKFQPIFEVNQQVQSVYDLKRADILKKEYDEKVIRAEALLAKYDSPMQGLGHIFVEQADKCNGDYKILLAIAGNESGFGKKSVKRFNPFGYLDGVQYASFEDAVTKISCLISQRFIYKCNSDINCIVKTYAGPKDDKQRWVFNINWFIQQI